LLICVYYSLGNQKLELATAEDVLRYTKITMQGSISLFKKIYLRLHRPADLVPFERKVYSQSGEDGIIEEIFRRIGTETKFAVEFGVEDGKECNTRFLKSQGWNVLQMDGNDNNPPSIKHEYITAENINQLFDKYDVPKNLDLLSIDIDSNDFWVWKALSTAYRPRLIVVEYNATIAPCFAQTVAYDPKLTWDGSNYFGASLLALYRIAKNRGYELVYCTKNGVNAFFVRKDLLGNKLAALTPLEAYRGPRFKKQAEEGVWLGHEPTDRKFVDIGMDLEAVNPKHRAD
jgi:hypothetical protein